MSGLSSGSRFKTTFVAPSSAEQVYLTFDQGNDFLPQDVTSPTDLRFALEGFQDIDIKILADVPADGTEGELESSNPARSPGQSCKNRRPVAIGETRFPPRGPRRACVSFPL